jgi:hypothetical protein
VAEEVAIIQSKRLRNKIAGFTTVSAAHRARAGALLLRRARALDLDPSTGTRP